MIRPAFRLFIASSVALGLAAVSGEALARPEMAGQNAASRFTVMDADKDGKVSREEFFAAQPQMKDAAFDAIDANKDGAISLEEWEGFASGHGHGGEMPPAGDGASGMSMPPKGQGGGTPPRDNDAKAAPELIMPPAKQ